MILKIVLSRIQRDEEIQYLDAEGNLSFVGYCSLNDKAYRGLFYNSYEEEALSRLDVWEAGTSNLLISVSVKTKLDTFNALGLRLPALMKVLFFII